MALTAGQRLGPYEIVAPVGAGGMGEVYRARDVRLERSVAIKILPPELAADARYRERFEREARAASAISHPHIAHVYDVGEQDGTHFIAMEYVEGENLRQLAAKGRLEVDRVVDLGLQIAEALEEAHARGVVHRDIKSANAVVTPRGQVKVLDFGLARQSRQPGEADSERVTEARTQAGLVVGTVPYMSPEQALGKDVDARTDLFSLGVVLYELATGRLPFAGDTATQTIDQICHASPAPIADSRKQVPPELERIVRKCLEKDRERRYSSARELAVDLRNLARDHASGESALASRPRTGRRRLPLLLGVAALVAALVAGAVALRRAAARGPGVGSVAVLPFTNTTGDPAIDYLSDGISESLINRLSSLPGLRVISRTSAFAFKGKALAPLDVGRKLGVDALLVGSLAQRGSTLAITAELVSVRDDTQLWGEKYSRPVDDVLQVESEIAATIAGRLRRQLSGEEKSRLSRGGTDDPEAYRLYLKGRDSLVGTLREMDRAVDYLQQAAARAPDYALAHAGLAEAYTRQAFLRAEGRTQALGKARAAVARALELDPGLAEGHAALALVNFYFEWDWAGAEAEFRKALELNPGSRYVHEEFGNFQTAMGRFEEGLAHSREAERLDPVSVGPVHDIALNYWLRGDLEQAGAGFRRTIEIDSNWTWGYIKLARVLARQKRCPEALAQADVAEARIRGSAAALSRAWLGATYGLCGETARARQKLAELHDQARTQYVDPSTFAGVHGSLGELDEALRWYEKAFEDRTPNMVYASVTARLAPEFAGNARFESIVRRMRFPTPPSR